MLDNQLVALLSIRLPEFLLHLRGCGKNDLLEFCRFLLIQHFVFLTKLRYFRYYSIRQYIFYIPIGFFQLFYCYFLCVYLITMILIHNIQSQYSITILVAFVKFMSRTLQILRSYRVVLSMVICFAECLIALLNRRFISEQFQWRVKKTRTNVMTTTNQSKC